MLCAPIALYHRNSDKRNPFWRDNWRFYRGMRFLGYLGRVIAVVKSYTERLPEQKNVQQAIYIYIGPLFGNLV